MKFFRIICLVLSLAFIFSCNNDNTETTEPAIPLEGIVAKGPIADASVSIYQINADGNRGDLVIGPFTTDEDGYWSSDTALTGTGPFEIVAAGGSYVDEATQETVELGDSDELLGLIDTSASTLDIAVTPYTHAALLAAKQMITTDGLSAQSAVLQAIGDIETAFGFDISQTLPPKGDARASASANQKTYASLLGGVAQLTDDNPDLTTLTNAHKFAIAIAIAQDIADGKLDGVAANGSAISVSVNSSDIPLPALDSSGIGELITAANSYAATDDDLADTTIADTTVAIGCFGGTAFTEKLKLTIDGYGFFEIKKDSEAMYTRYGSFCLTADGYIKSINGGLLQGFPVDSAGNVSSSTPKSINILQDGYSLSDVTNITIKSGSDIYSRGEGNVSVEYNNNPPVIVGQIAIITFPSQWQLRELDHIYCGITESSGRAVASSPGTSGVGTIISGQADITGFDNCIGNGEDGRFTISADNDGYFRFQDMDNEAHIYLKEALVGINIEGKFFYAEQKNIEYIDGKWINNVSDLRLLGYAVDANGDISSDDIGEITVTTGAADPSATTGVIIAANIDANEAVNAAAATTKAEGGTAAQIASAVAIAGAADFSATDTTTYNHSTLTTAYNSLGQDHQLTTYFQKVDSNTWNCYLEIDGDAITSGVPAQNYITLNFTSDGALTSWSNDANITQQTNTYTISFNATWPKYGYGTITISDLDFSGLTQYESDFSVTTISQNGYCSGEFIDMTVDTAGRFIALFSNEQSQVLGVVATATFTDTDSLVAEEIGYSDPGNTAVMGSPTELGVTITFTAGH